MAGQQERLVKVARELGGSPDALVAVDLEVFFDKNHDPGSIAPNLDSHPGPQAIYEMLLNVRERLEVSSVAVLVRLEFDEYPDGDWPFAEAVHVVTAAAIEEINAVSASIEGAAAFEGEWESEIRNLPTIAQGMRVVTIWWD